MATRRARPTSAKRLGYVDRGPLRSAGIEFRDDLQDGASGKRMCGYARIRVGIRMGHRLDKRAC